MWTGQPLGGQRIDDGRWSPTLALPECLKFLALFRGSRFVYIQATGAIAIAEVSGEDRRPEYLAAVELHAISPSRANIVQYSHCTPPKSRVSRSHHAGTEHLTTTGFKNLSSERPWHRFALPNTILNLNANA